jgi:hypothetical protein
MPYEYRIEYAIQRRDTTRDDDFVEIGFGSSGTEDSIRGAVHMLDSAVSNGIWETEPGMPEPAEVMTDRRTY